MFAFSSNQLTISSFTESELLFNARTDTLSQSTAIPIRISLQSDRRAIWRANSQHLISAIDLPPARIQVMNFFLQWEADVDVGDQVNQGPGWTDRDHTNSVIWGQLDLKSPKFEVAQIWVSRTAVFHPIKRQSCLIMLCCVSGQLYIIVDEQESWC